MANSGSHHPDLAARFRSTREAHRDETAEDYVEAVMHLIVDKGEARVTELAKMMGVSHVTVTRIVARLSREGLLEAKPYRPVGLTATGRRMADRIIERHEVVLGFLKALGVPAKQAEIDAEGIEHHVSEATIRAMRTAMKGAMGGAAGGAKGKKTRKGSGGAAGAHGSGGGAGGGGGHGGRGGHGMGA